VIATWREPSRAQALGLSRIPWKSAVGYGLLGLVASYVVATVAVVIYLIGASLAHHGAASGVAFDPAPIDVPGGVVGKELENKAAWASKLGAIPLWMALPIALFAGFYEEVLFRGFVLGRLRVILGDGIARTAIAIALSSALFAAGHGYQGGLGLAQTFAAGVTLATLAAWRRSIWPSIVAHALIDSLGLVALHALRPILEQLRHHAG
jgi:membrane protease YdiL (CAAX protease family)